MLAEAFPLGNWRSLVEMEDALTIEELTILLNVSREKQDQQNKFLAALKGIDLDESRQDADFEAVQRRAAADAAGISEEKYVFESIIGIEFDDDDDN